MKLQFKISNDLVFIDKPAGFSTHSPDLGKKGICEILEASLGVKLYVVQRLDKTTTGCLIFAMSPEKAAELTSLFSSRAVTKRYLFVTTGRSDQMEFENNNPIDGKVSQTLFKRLKRTPFFELWEAFPQTGRAHQIRIHAAELGLPILGDEMYGGVPFPHLCLHAQQLQIPGYETFISPPPFFMERLGLLKDTVLCQWLSQMDRRQRLYGFLKEPKESLRLIHSPELRLDQFGDQLYFYWYHSQEPTWQDLNRCEFVAGLFGKKWLLRKMQNRGDDPNARQVWNSSDWQMDWTAQENGLNYQFHSDVGQSPGLFLDQREYRLEVLQKSSGKNVLNLFSYTCGFSLNAARGGAHQVVSVDLSRTFLDWGQQNFNLNQLSGSQYEFYFQESMLFLKGAVKRNRLFDLIICDPPSFGRHKNGVFKLDQDFPELLKLCWQVLAPGGEMLFSCNFEKWTADDIEKRIRATLKGCQISQGKQAYDFELPNTEALMKSYWIRKKNG